MLSFGATGKVVPNPLFIPISPGAGLGVSAGINLSTLQVVVTAQAKASVGPGGYAGYSGEVGFSRGNGIKSGFGDYGWSYGGDVNVALEPYLPLSFGVSVAGSSDGAGGAWSLENVRGLRVGGGFGAEVSATATRSGGWASSGLFGIPKLLGLDIGCR